MGEKKTTLDADLDKPQVTEPGDAPADTTDPTERASSATPDKGAAAQAGHGTVNAVVPVDSATAEAPRRSRKKDRVETYEAVKPDGTTVTVEHNIDTGESRIK